MADISHYILGDFLQQPQETHTRGDGSMSLDGGHLVCAFDKTHLTGQLRLYFSFQVNFTKK